MQKFHLPRTSTSCLGHVGITLVANQQRVSLLTISVPFPGCRNAAAAAAPWQLKPRGFIIILFWRSQCKMGFTGPRKRCQQGCALSQGPSKKISSPRPPGPSAGARGLLPTRLPFRPLSHVLRSYEDPLSDLELIRATAPSQHPWLTFPMLLLPCKVAQSQVWGVAIFGAGLFHPPWVVLPKWQLELRASNQHSRPSRSAHSIVTYTSLPQLVSGSYAQGKDS